jgi:hypothetical protein
MGLGSNDSTSLARRSIAGITDDRPKLGIVTRAALRDALASAPRATAEGLSRQAATPRLTVQEVRVTR